MPQAIRILCCQCARSGAVPGAVRDEVVARLRASGLPFDAVADLCGLAAARDPLLGQVAAAEDARIIACFPRAVRWLFAAAGAPLRQGGVKILNLRTQSADEIVAAALDGTGRPAGGGPLRREGAKVLDPRTESADEIVAAGLDGTGWQPWFPVIDGDRCKSCRQCLNFCLFGVFGLSGDERVEVQNPARCKTNCPACARVCPQAAIIFPKYPAAPINGDEVTEENLRREDMDADLQSRLGGDLYATLRRRAQQAGRRFSAERDQQRALQERLRCACDSKDASRPGDAIQSLMSLPLADVVPPSAQAILHEAKERANVRAEGPAAPAAPPRDDKVEDDRRE